MKRIAHMPISNNRLTSLILIVREETKTVYIVYNRPDGVKVDFDWHKWTFPNFKNNVDALKAYSNYDMRLIDIDGSYRESFLAKLTPKELKYIKSIKWEKKARW